MTRGELALMERRAVERNQTVGALSLLSRDIPSLKEILASSEWLRRAVEDRLYLERDVERGTVREAIGEFITTNGGRIMTPKRLEEIKVELSGLAEKGSVEHDVCVTEYRKLADELWCEVERRMYLEFAAERAFIERRR